MLVFFSILIKVNHIILKSLFISFCRSKVLLFNFAIYIKTNEDILVYCISSILIKVNRTVMKLKIYRRILKALLLLMIRSKKVSVPWIT